MEQLPQRLYQRLLTGRARATKPSLIHTVTRPVSVASVVSINQQHKNTASQKQRIAGILALSAFGYSTCSLKQQAEASPHTVHFRDPHPGWQAGDRVDKPSFSREEVLKHKTQDSLWMTYRYGVYDLTEFAEEHPGAVERLLLGCKGDHDICGWWKQLGYHNVADIHLLLERYRIGNITDEDYLECAVETAAVHPTLRKARSALNDTAFSYEPFIAETPIEILNKHFYTPSEYHYVRNHFAVPLHLDWDSTFTISGIGVPQNTSPKEEDDDDDEDEGYSLKYKDLLQLPMVTRDVYLQCGGHRRIEYNQFGTTTGSKWDVGAIGNAKYRGVLLRDVLKHIGVDVDALYEEERDLHVWFVGADCAPDGEGYGVSIPAYKALDPKGDVMLAVEYNDEPLTPDHGFPVRVLVPGWVGARSVKWIENIIISDKQCDMKSYTKSYRLNKGFTQEMRDLPVNSSIQWPQHGDQISIEKDGILTISGEAHSGDGKPIIRVDVSVDGGKTWNEGKLLNQPHNLAKKKWSWTKWECQVDVSELQKEVGKREEGAQLELVCRAMDLSHNRQPETCKADLTFNPKGYSANPYHRIRVNVTFEQ